MFVCNGTTELWYTTMYLLGKCQSWLRYVCMYVFVMGKMFPLSTHDLLFNSVGYTEVVAQISSVSAALTDFQLQTCFYFVFLLLQSSVCHLRGLDERQLLAVKEEALEMGG